MHEKTVREGLAAVVMGCVALASVAQAANPSTIYAYDMDGSSASSKVLMASLSGVVARTSPEVHMAHRTTTPHNDPEFWLDRHVENNPSTNVVWQSNPLWFIDRYKSQLNGYVVYDGSTINQATSVAGALGALMVEQSQLSGPIGPALVSAGLSQVEDVRGRSSDWAYDTYRNSYNDDFIYRQQPQFLHQLRSHAIKNAGFVFDETGSTRDRFLAGQNPHSAVVGWGHNNDEFEFFSSASDYNLAAVPADHLQSAASMSGWSVDPPTQAHHAASDTPTNPGAHYVAFVMSDGDNVQWLNNDFPTSDRWFGSPHRGDFPMTFDVTPSVADFNPTALKYFYDQAAGDSEKTYFVNPGGYGISYPSRLSDVEGYVDKTVEAMQSADQRIISILDPDYDTDALNALAARPEIQGVMFKTNSDAYAGNDGEVYWHNGTPVASVRHTLWDGFDTPDTLVGKLNSAPRQAITDTASYSIVNVHPWSTSLTDGGQGDPMSNVQYVVDNLAPGVEVVTLDELFVHLTNNRETLTGQPTGDNLVANADFETIDPNNASRPIGWSYAGGGATSLITGDDSDGIGIRTAAINEANADWRSEGFSLVDSSVFPGDELQFSFDFKFLGVADGEGFRGDARFFDDPEGSGGSFVGETTAFIDAADYDNGEWHSFSVTAMVPAGAEMGDLRLSTFFGVFAGGQVLIDNVALTAPLSLAGDFNEDGMVDAADYTVWRDSYNQNVQPGTAGDGDGDGFVDDDDLQLWRSNYGASNATASAAVPEPTTAILLLPAGLALLHRTSSR